MRIGLNIGVGKPVRQQAPNEIPSGVYMATEEDQIISEEDNVDNLIVEE